MNPGVLSQFVGDTPRVCRRAIPKKTEYPFHTVVAIVHDSIRLGFYTVHFLCFTRRRLPTVRAY